MVRPLIKAPTEKPPGLFTCIFTYFGVILARGNCGYAPAFLAELMRFIESVDNAKALILRKFFLDRGDIGDVYGSVFVKVTDIFGFRFAVFRRLCADGVIVDHAR